MILSRDSKSPLTEMQAPGYSQIEGKSANKLVKNTVLQKR